MEIDVSKCTFYNNGKCNNPNGMACNCCNNAYCYYKELQQLKVENEKLCTAIRNELPEQYDKRVSEAESDIEWGVLDRNATEAEFCKNVIYETRNYIAKLKQENEELRSDNSMLLTQGDADAFVISNLNFKIQKFQQCLDEIIEQIESIEATAERIFEDNCITLARAISKYSRNILQLSRQVKEGGG